VSDSEEQLKAGQLGMIDVTASTVANIGPGIDFYFVFGVIAVTAGIAAPLTILAAGVAVALLALTVAEFTKAEPSAGSFITYVETSLGARAGVVVAVLVAVGYTVAIAGVFTMSGGMVSLTLAHYTSWQPPWEPLTLVLAPDRPRQRLYEPRFPVCRVLDDGHDRDSVCLSPNHTGSACVHVAPPPPDLFSASTHRHPGSGRADARRPVRGAM
jgi:hypothetical protein